jgi:hypothetical protein
MRWKRSAEAIARCPLRVPCRNETPFSYNPSPRKSGAHRFDRVGLWRRLSEGQSFRTRRRRRQLPMWEMWIDKNGLQSLAHLARFRRVTEFRHQSREGGSITEFGEPDHVG